MINSFWVSNGSFYFEFCDNVLVMSITHVSDLQKHFDVNQLVMDLEASFLQGCFN